MKQKRLLVLAAGLLQMPVIKKGRELGYYVIAADGNKNAVGLRFADKAICANITDPDEMLRVAVEEQIDGVIHPCSEVSMSVMGRINDTLHLSGVSEEAAQNATNKHLMREALKRHNAPSPLSFCFADSDEAWKVFQSDFKSDAILKPSRNSGSRGIHKITHCISKNEFITLFEHSLSESRDKSAMLEQFIDGPEFSVEIIVWHGDITVLAVTDKKTTEAPHFVELGHSQPSQFSKDEVNAIIEAATAGVQALGVDNCACHAEIKLMNNSLVPEAYIMEIGARLGGDFISTVLTELSTGVDMVAAAIRCAMGEKPDLTPRHEKNGVCIRYFCPSPGTLSSISNLEVLDSPSIYEYDIYVSAGDIIPEVTSSLSRSGHVIVTATNARQAVELADGIINSVHFNVKK